MHMWDIQLPDTHQRFIDRFVGASRADARVVAAFLGGSYAKGEADAYSDLALGLITTDAAYGDSLAGRGVSAAVGRSRDLESL
jgi:predicted nucleotidyltransferase